MLKPSIVATTTKVVKWVLPFRSTSFETVAPFATVKVTLSSWEAFAKACFRLVKSQTWNKEATYNLNLNIFQKHRSLQYKRQ